MIVDQVEPVLGEVVVISYDGDHHPDDRSFHGSASAILDNECKYDGQFRNGMFHGKGTFKWPNGVKFEGDFVKGQIWGKGVYEWSDSSSYQGDVMGGLRHGTGRFVGSSGQVYEGEWVNGKRHGKGKIWYNEERTSSFNGDWFANLRHGYGTMKYSTGNSYEGEWRNDKKSGFGLMIWRDVDEIYTGEWLNDVPNGLGEHVWGDSNTHTVKKEVCNIYRGHFVDGQREGLGAFFYMNGSKYVGDWIGDAKEGEGVFLYADGRIFGGLFKQNRMITDFAKDESSAPRATEAVNPQFKLNIFDLFDCYPSLLQTSSVSSPLSCAPGTKTIAGAAGVSIRSVRVAKDSPVASFEERCDREVKEMERLLLKYNHFLRSAIRRYTDFANKRRLREALQKHQLLASWAPNDTNSRAFKACATARIFQKRLFCMNLEHMVRFLRESGIIGPYFRSYDLSQCFLQMREESKIACVERLRAYKKEMRMVESAATLNQKITSSEDFRTHGYEGEYKTEDDGEREEEGSSERPEQGETAEELEKYLNLDITQIMDGYLHANVKDPDFSTLSCQPLLEREFVELFVRAVAVSYVRARISPSKPTDPTATLSPAIPFSDMSISQILYYVLAHKLQPVVTNLEEHCSMFYREFYYDEVQTLLLSNEVTTTASGTILDTSTSAAPASSSSPKARSPSAQPKPSVDTVSTEAPAAVSGTAGSVSFSGEEEKENKGSSGTSTPTCFEKLWAHLKKGNTQHQQQQPPSPVTVCGAELGPIHSAGPPALSSNRTGGSIRLKVLMNYLLSLRGVVLTSETSILSLILATECAPPNPRSALTPPAPTPSASNTAATPATAAEGSPGGETPATAPTNSESREQPAEGSESIEETTVAPTAAPTVSERDFDMSCLDARIDFLDFLELLCRVISSDLWCYSPAFPASSGLLPSVKVSKKETPQGDDQDSASIYSVSLADILAERIGVWKQTFDFDALHLPPTAAYSAEQPEQQSREEGAPTQQ